MIETGIDDIIERIREINGQLVILDVDLADLYGVTPADLRAMVRRNRATFTVDFVISLARGGSRRRNLAFTEHGVIVAASMLGDTGIEELSIHVVRTFVKLREENGSDVDLAHRIEKLDQAIKALDERLRRQFSAIYDALGKLPVSGAATGQSKRRRLH